jgi:hypothetical protein
MILCKYFDSTKQLHEVIPVQGCEMDLDPDTHGSALILVSWIRIRIRIQ